MPWQGSQTAHGSISQLSQPLDEKTLGGTMWANQQQWLSGNQRRQKNGFMGNSALKT
jgi:hypothetical protein